MDPWPYPDTANYNITTPQSSCVTHVPVKICRKKKVVLTKKRELWHAVMVPGCYGLVAHAIRPEGHRIGGMQGAAAEANQSATEGELAANWGLRGTNPGPTSGAPCVPALGANAYRQARRADSCQICVGAPGQPAFRPQEGPSPKTLGPKHTIAH